MARLTAEQFRKMFPQANNEPVTRALGRGLQAIADPLNQYRLPESMPVVGGISAADFTGLTGAQGVLQDFSKGDLQSGDMRMFDLLGLGAGAVPVAKTALKGGGLLGKEALRQMNEGTGLLSKVTIDPKMNVVETTRMGDIGFDPRFDPRKLEQERLNRLTTKVDVPEIQVPKLSLVDYEGYPFITSMSDRTNVGMLQSINDVPVNVDLQGGQNYMFNNAGQAWASAKAPSQSIIKNAKMLKEITGKDPLYMPWRMAPTGGDFANMTGETMLKYMSSNMSKSAQRKVNKDIKKFIPNFKGVGSEEGINQFRTVSDKTRKALKNMLDTKYRNEGGLSIGEARLAVSDPTQLLAKDSGLQNVGRIFADQPMIQQSGHKAYPKGVAGEGLGLLDKDIMAFELLPNAAQARGIANPRMPSQQDIRALQMKPYSGIITSDMLKKLGY
jgi:hypothetical protein